METRGILRLVMSRNAAGRFSLRNAMFLIPFGSWTGVWGQNSSSRVPCRRFRTEVHVGSPASREFARMNRQQKHERHIVQFISQAPGSLYDIGVGWKSEWRTLASIDPLGNATTNVFDDVDRPTTTIDPLGRRNTTSYDPAGRTTASIDAWGHATTLAYDAAGRRVETTDARGAVATTVIKYRWLSGAAETTAAPDGPGGGSGRIFPGLSVPLSPPQFPRKACISFAANSGVPERVLRKWIGHVDREVLDWYYHLADPESQAAMKRLSDAAKQNQQDGSTDSSSAQSQHKPQGGENDKSAK